MAVSAKDLLLKQTREAFGENDEMSHKAALWRVTSKMASMPSLAPGMRTIEQVVRHVAVCKSMYCHQAFGTPEMAIPDGNGKYTEYLACLEKAQITVVECMANCSEDDLSGPVPTKSHGESAAHLFWILLMHDLWHAGQIKARWRVLENTRKQ